MKTDPRIDAYISKSADFGKPILRHLRELVHEGCPDVEETLKWSMPHFMYKDVILCSMAAFKAHAVFGFRHQGMDKVLGEAGSKANLAMGSMGRITSLNDLPSDREMVGFIRAAAKLHAFGAPARPARAAKKLAAVRPPADLAAALKKNKRAATTFANFSNSNRKDYVEWLTEAKREETRKKRLATAIEWLAAGKARNWKYE